jgi:hypothetical protein
MSDQKVQADFLQAVSKPGDALPQNDLTVEQLTLLINTTRVRDLETLSKTEFLELKKRQDKVRLLHNLLKLMNHLTDTKGNLDLSKNTDVHQLLKSAKEFGVDLDETKHNYSKEEKDRLIENIRMTIEDLNVQNELQVQTISRLTNERYESFQMARSIMKPIHEDKINKLRSAGGR